MVMFSGLICLVVWYVRFVLVVCCCILIRGLRVLLLIWLVSVCGWLLNRVVVVLLCRGLVGGRDRL